MKLFFAKLTLASFFITCTFNVMSAEISQAQIEQFKQLSPSQQQALASSMGVDLSALKGFGGATSNSTAQSSPSLNQLVPARDSQISEQSFEPQNENVIVEESAIIESERLQFSSTENTQKLKPFGYDLFAGEPSTFAPVSDVPIPSEYRIGPGDSLSIQLYGKETVSYNLTVNRQGNIDIPQLGPINIAAVSYTHLTLPTSDLV